MLHVVHYLRATNMSISTDLSFKMRLQLFENFSFSINHFVRIFQVTENFELLRSKLLCKFFISIQNFVANLISRLFTKIVKS